MKALDELEKLWCQNMLLLKCLEMADTKVSDYFKQTKEMKGAEEIDKQYSNIQDKIKLEEINEVCQSIVEDECKKDNVNLRQKLQKVIEKLSIINKKLDEKEELQETQEENEILNSILCYED